jgi:2-oxoglutarate dehydrogenase E2 component (dihydrolipoamide succinyltransferase)
MTTDLIVPALGESVSEATVAKWFKDVGDTVTADEPLVELETDKVTVEVNAPVTGTIAEILAPVGADVAVGALLARITSDGRPALAKPPAAAATEGERAQGQSPVPLVRPEPGVPTALLLSPAVRKLIEERRLDPADIPASGKDGRLTKGDVIAYLEARAHAPMVSERSAPIAAPPAATIPTPPAARPAPKPSSQPDAPAEERVRMTRLRKMVAQRLKDAQNTAAMLTTFNEIDMSAANALRAHYKDSFEKKHGVRLGVMSLFVKACVVALKEFPAVNAEIDGDEIVYKNHYDVAIAVSSPQGLVVPVVRDCETLSFAEIEARIADFGKRAKDGALTLEEMQGGTFTITNGGVFGSLMSTPILNPPQSGILGMHKIQNRPMVMADGAIVARPMMYVALSYDHRIIDGREAVSFLVRVKECVEDPQRILLQA